jgi:hypothetical protein
MTPFQGWDGAFILNSQFSILNSQFSIVMDCFAALRNDGVRVCVIPVREYRSVEGRIPPRAPHPDRDASLTGCRCAYGVPFSTGRCIPTGCRASLPFLSALSFLSF